MAAAKRPKSRLTHPAEDKLTPEQQELRDAIKSGPRGRFVMGGPFAIYMEAPKLGLMAQQLGGHVRLETSVPPRLSEFAILCTSRTWRAQYEWIAHAPIAEKQGVAPATIQAIQAGRRPNGAPDDELAVYDFVKELYRDRRVSDGTYAKLHKLLGDKGMVELVGILGYYGMVAMMLNVFRAETDPEKPLPFREPLAI